MNCPKCNEPIPDDLVASEGARIMAARRKNPKMWTKKQAREIGKRGGRPRKEKQ
jgi:hypothetical protein